MPVMHFSTARNGAVGAITLAGLAAIIVACGRRDAPRCSAPEVEDLVAKLIFESSSEYNGGSYYSPFTKAKNWYLVRKNDDGSALIITADVGNLMQSDKFTFDAERERGYDEGIRKRSCAADISGSIDETGLSQVIHVRNEAALVENGANMVSDTVVSSLSQSEGQGKPMIISQTDVHDAQLKLEDHALKVMQAVRWNNPQNYTAQITDKGDTYVALSE